MMRRRKGRTFHVREPFSPGHICSARDAEELNERYAKRVGEKVDEWLEKNSQTTDQELQLWLETFEEGLLERRNRHIMARRGLAGEILSLAEETYDREKVGQEIETQAAKAARIKELSRSEGVMSQAKERFEKRTKARREVLLSLLGEEEEGGVAHG